MSRPEAKGHVTGTRKWEYITYSKPVVSLKNFFLEINPINARNINQNYNTFTKTQMHKFHKSLSNTISQYNLHKLKY